MRSSPSSRSSSAQPVSNGLGCGGQQVCTYRLASLHLRSDLGLGSRVGSERCVGLDRIYPLGNTRLPGLRRRVLLRHTRIPSSRSSLPRRHSHSNGGSLSLCRGVLRRLLSHLTPLHNLLRDSLLGRRLLRRGLRRLGTHLHSAHGAAQGDLASKAEGQHRGVGCESGICTCVDKLHVHVWRAVVRYGVCAVRCRNMKLLRRRSVVTDSSNHKMNNSKKARTYKRVSNEELVRALGQTANDAAAADRELSKTPCAQRVLGKALVLLRHSLGREAERKLPVARQLEGSGVRTREVRLREEGVPVRRSLQALPDLLPLREVLGGLSLKRSLLRRAQTLWCVLVRRSCGLCFIPPTASSEPSC